MSQDLGSKHVREQEPVSVYKELEMWAGVLTIAAAGWFVFFLGVSFLVRVLHLVMREQ